MWSKTNTNKVGNPMTVDEAESNGILDFPEESQQQDIVYIGKDLLANESSLLAISELLVDTNEDEEEEDLGIFVRDGYKAVSALAQKGINLPAWADQWKNESAWANSMRWSANETLRLVWSIDEMLVFQSPFILSVDDSLRSMNADVEWSDSVGGWIFPWFDDDMLEELQEIISNYGFTASASASTLLNGTLDSEIIISDTMIDAEEEGYRIPTGFASDRELKEHQKRGVLSTLARRRVLLADSPGLGKGGIFVSAILAEFERGLRDEFEFDDDEVIDMSNEEYLEHIDEFFSPVLVICQSSMVYPLALEISRWWEDATITVMKGKAECEVEKSNFIICPISIVADRLDDIAQVEPKSLIVDECHMLKNPESGRTIAVQQIADRINEYGDELVENEKRDSTLIILVSGTPMPNRPSELWSLLNVLGETEPFVEAASEEMSTTEINQPFYRNGRLQWKMREMSDKEIFERRWCAGGFGEQYLAGKGKGYVWMNFGASNLSELHRVLSETVMIRRKKRDVIQLPAPYERIVPVPLNDEQMEEYQEMKKNFRQYMFDIADEYADKWEVPLETAIRMLRGKLDFAEPLIQMSKLTQFVSRSKTDQIVKWVIRFMEGDKSIIDKDADKRKKLIVFAHHIDTQNELINNEELQKYGMVSILAGSKDVVEVTERFQKDDDCRLIICYSGAREGHTLTASYDVLIAEPPPVPSQAEQMACRCYARVSEDFEPHVAYVHYAITPNTVDVLQLRRMNLKKGISDAVIDGEDDPSRSDKKEKEKRTAIQNEAEATLIMELVLEGDETMRIAT